MSNTEVPAIYRRIGGRLLVTVNPPHGPVERFTIDAPTDDHTDPRSLVTWALETRGWNVVLGWELLSGDIWHARVVRIDGPRYLRIGQIIAVDESETGCE